ncbi:MAG: hypothetical protein D6806_17575 [Deltaproteobacteria bacterium]|nr:MAG: hypothetical protein D6806_17575 [Deltaproteobacteria bacterium]
MRHPEALQLEMYLDGEMPAGRRREIEAHVSGCDSCRRQLESMSACGSLLRQAIEQETNDVNFDGFAERVLAEARRRQPVPAGQWLRTWLGEFLAARWPALAAAAAAAVLVAAVVAGMVGPRQAVEKPRATAAPALASARGQQQQGGNRAIIDSMEYTGRRSMIFTVSRNNTTVIWLYDFDRAEGGGHEGEDL